MTIMKLIKLYIVLFLCISVCGLMFSCSEKTDSVATISFNPKAKKRSVFETGVIKDIKLIKLESDSCIIGKIDKILRNDSLLYILDRYIAKEVFIFTIEGKFVNKISRQGHGKYEYIRLWDIFFDKGSNTLCLLSDYDQKIISFTPDGKKVLGESKLPQMFSFIVPIKEGYIGYMKNYVQNHSLPYNIWTMDKSFNLLDGFVRIAPQLECQSQSEVRALSAYKDVVYFKPEFDNNIYQIKDGEISKRYILHFGSKTVPDLSTIDRDVEMGLMLLSMNTVANIYNYIETNKYLLMDFRMDDEYYMGIYNKHKRTSEIVKLGYYKDEYIFPFGCIKGMDQYAIYSVVDYDGVYKRWLGRSKYVNFEEKYPKQVKNLRKLFPHLKEDGNPFIAIYSLK